jgi:DNA-binding NarL/FixJ family response regulator
VKDAAEPDILQAIHKVAQGGLFFSSVISDSLLTGYVRRLREEESKDSYDLLTDREKEILRLLAMAKSNKEVAAELNLSPSTVETHRNNLMQKLDLHSAAEIVLYAVRKRIIEH